MPEAAFTQARMALRAAPRGLARGVRPGCGPGSLEAPGPGGGGGPCMPREMVRDSRLLWPLVRKPAAAAGLQAVADPPPVAGLGSSQPGLRAGPDGDDEAVRERVAGAGGRVEDQLQRVAEAGGGVDWESGVCGKSGDVRGGP